MIFRSVFKLCRSKFQPIIGYISGVKVMESYINFVISELIKEPTVDTVVSTVGSYMALYLTIDTKDPVCRLGAKYQ